MKKKFLSQKKQPEYNQETKKTRVYTENKAKKQEKPRDLKESSKELMKNTKEAFTGELSTNSIKNHQANKRVIERNPKKNFELVLSRNI